MPEIISKLLHRHLKWLSCSNGIYPFLVDVDLVLCTGCDSQHADLFPCHMFTQSPINDCKIELSFENGFDLQRVLAQPIEI